MATVFPGIVMGSEVCAPLDAGMAVEPEFREGVRVGILKPCAAKDVKSVDGGLARAGNDAVDGFLPVDVGLVLKVTADGVCAGFDEEAGDGQHEEERDETGAAVEGFDLPPRTADVHEPRGNAGADPEDEEEACGRNGETPGDVVQNVVTGLVGEDEKDFVIGDAAGRGVP